ncbi:flagellar hook-length control protein FliK [Pantoea sp. DY-15]|uniref:flagellar hook-length control protein FliK n=1 Tax=Pantoea sp. DY-15 TaxID=2871489 RepID=UPI001C95A867|nr:flagellar hook-length control protein FliK [Pantoea sp. DY-15]MBY4890022.1 flagellar hook-length control protein FliK [Pantoea sp. DY-15]
MIPSLTSFVLSGSSAPSVAPGTPGATELANTPLPLVPMFMLGGSVPAPVQAPPLQVAEEDALPESGDPEQLMQLLLDPALSAPVIAPQPPIVTPTPLQYSAPQQLPELAALARPAVLPQNAQSAQPAMLAGQVITPAETLPSQPVKLRTPQDARDASKQVLAMMQASPEEPLAKMLPAQVIAHSQQPIATNKLNVQPGFKTQAPLALPEAAHEKAAVLREALGDRLQMQVDQRTQKATIRLDPPNLGKLDIALHYEGGKLQVQIQAAQPDVYRALQQVSQELRGALSEQNQVAVNVQISQQQGEQRQAPRQQPEQEVVLSNNIAEVTEEQCHRDLSILTTV